LESGRFASAGRTTDVNGSVARVEDELDSMLLFWPQAVGGNESIASAKALASADSAIDEIDHLALALEAADGSDFVTVPQNRAGGLLQGQCAFQLRVVDVAAPVAKCLGQNLVVAGN
jgi:predicted ATP-grasp superfamily ATP-dependent carboligase